MVLKTNAFGRGPDLLGAEGMLIERPKRPWTDLDLRTWNTWGTWEASLDDSEPPRSRAHVASGERVSQSLRSPVLWTNPKGYPDTSGSMYWCKEVNRWRPSL